MKNSFPKVIASEGYEPLKTVDFNDTFLNYWCLICFKYNLIICLENVSLLVISHKYFTV